MIHILDPAEQSLPYRGHVAFQNQSGGLKSLVRSVTHVKSAYMDKMQAHAKMLQTLCHKHGWHYEQCVTDSDPKPHILNILNAMSGVK